MRPFLVNRPGASQKNPGRPRTPAAIHAIGALSERIFLPVHFHGHAIVRLGGRLWRAAGVAAGRERGDRGRSPKQRGEKDEAGG